MRLKRQMEQVVDHAILLAGTFVMVTPVLMLLLASMRTPDAAIGVGSSALLESQFWQSAWENYRKALTTKLGFSGEITASGMFLNSLLVAFAFGVCKTVLSVISAYALVFFRVRWAAFWFWSILVTLFLPLESRPMATYLTASYFGLTDSLPGLVIPLLLSGLGVFIFRQYLLSLPKELFEAAVLDGAKPTRFLFEIIIPISLPFTVALFAIYFAEGWNQYMWPLMSLAGEENYTLLRGIELVARQSSLGLVFICLTFLPPLLLAVCCTRLIARALVVGSDSLEQ